MGSEAETRRNDKLCLFQILIAKHESTTPSDLNKLLAWQKAHMEPEDVKLVLQEFEEWVKSL
jgi:hypothetical protein